MNFFFTSVLSILGAQLASYTFVLIVIQEGYPSWVAGLVWSFQFIPTIAYSLALSNIRLIPVGEATLRLSLAAMAVTLLCGSLYMFWEPSKLILITISIIYGFSFSLVPLSRSVVIKENYSASSQERVISWLNISAVLSLGMAPILFAVIVHYSSYHSVWIVSSLLIFIGFLFRLDFNRNVRPTDLENIKDKSRERYYALLQCGLSVWFLGPFQVLLPAYISNKYELNELERSAFMASIAVGLIISGLSVNRIRIFYGINGSLFLIIVSGVLSILSFQAESLYSSVILLVLVSLFSGIIANKSHAFVIRYTPYSNIERSSANVSLVFIGVPAASGLIAGFLTNIISVETVVFTLGVLQIIAALTVYFWRLRNDPPLPEELKAF